MENQTGSKQGVVALYAGERRIGDNAQLVGVFASEDEAMIGLQQLTNKRGTDGRAGNMIGFIYQSANGPIIWQDSCEVGRDQSCLSHMRFVLAPLETAPQVRRIYPF